MKCPNCSHEAPGDAAECPSCHLVFSKWRAPIDRPRRTSAASGGWGRWVGLLLLAVCAWAYARFSADPSAAGQEAAGALSAKEAGAVGDVAFKPPSDHCGYAGRVMDAALLTPIPGAKVYLDAYVATADASGRYRIIVRAMRGACEPFPSARHPLYQKNYWTRHFTELDAEDRFALRAQSAAAERVRGKPGEVTTLHFSLFPIEIPDSLLRTIAANAGGAEAEDGEEFAGD